MKTRRKFLAWAGAGLASACAHQPSASGPIIGLQLYTILAELAADPAAALARVHALGVREVELVASQATPDFAAMLSAAGLRARSIHMSIGESTDEALARAAAMGVSWVVCPFPPIPESVRTRAMSGVADWATFISEEDWRGVAAGLNEVGARARSFGLHYGYHNHQFEYLPVDGVPALHRLAEWTDPAHVDFEIDCAWAAAAGADPAAEIRRFGARCRLLHIKDVAPGEASPTAQRRPVPLGEGVVDVAALLQAAREVRVEAGFVEQDPPSARPIFESLETSFAHLRALGAIE